MTDRVHRARPSEACGRLLRLRPDADHPVTRGFACHKGVGFDAIHHDPDRLDVPLKRGAQGFTPLYALFAGAAAVSLAAFMVLGRRLA